MVRFMFKDVETDERSNELILYISMSGLLFENNNHAIAKVRGNANREDC